MSEDSNRKLDSEITKNQKELVKIVGEWHAEQSLTPESLVLLSKVVENYNRFLEIVAPRRKSATGSASPRS